MSVESRVKGLVHLGACRRAYWAFSFMTGLPFLISLAAFIDDPSFWEPLVVCSFILGLCFLWLGSLRIMLDDNGISYRSMTSGTICVPWSEIAKAEMKVGYKDYWDRFKPPFRLVVEPLPSSGKRRIVVNMKIFSQEDGSLLLNTLKSKLVDRFKWNERIPL